MGSEHFKDVKFVKFGEFNREQLIWWSPKEGYFVTTPLGRSLDGASRIPIKIVEKLAHERK